MERKYDFSGWVTRNDIKCSDGRIIRQDAFSHNDGLEVPLVWNHDHDSPLNVLGKIFLENRSEGVYGYGTFNDTESGQAAKDLVKHGDIKGLSIYANQLKHQGNNVLHGNIREVSLVLAGANPGAFIVDVVKHGDFVDESIIYFDCEISDDIMHSEDKKNQNEFKKKESGDEKMEKNKEKEAPKGEKTIQELFDEFTDEQKDVVYAIVGLAVEQARTEMMEDGGDDMKQNVFEDDEMENGLALSHADQTAIFTDAKRYGSLKESTLAHGIEQIDYLFPDAKEVSTPDNFFIKRKTGWVDFFMKNVGRSPFSRIKSTHGNLTTEEARAKGYFKGKLKKEEVFTLLKRTTTPTTIYKKQKIDRDDQVDITDFDTVRAIKTEMRFMLDEEIARAALIGDGRLSSSDDKINEQNIRPIASDSDLYTIKADFTPADTKPATIASEFIVAAVKARKSYQGSGSPTLFISEDMLTELLLLKDTTGRDLYEDETKLAKKLRVDTIVEVPAMDTLESVNNKKLIGIIVNLQDYKVGADKGGEVNLFDDFDIDYNAQKYLIETRCSGALTVPYSAIAVYQNTSADTSN